MAKTKISEFSTTAGNNTDINSINIAEGCAPSGINDAIRELMRQLKEFQTGGAGDSVNSGGDFSVATNKFTVASASGNTAVAGTLAVTGTTTLTGALVANGNATLGDGSGDTVTVKGTPTLEVNPTLSGGTANGVLYLNGSKVATSGSAFTFDGITLGVNSTSNGITLINTGSTGTAVNQNMIFNHSPGGGAYVYTSIQLSGTDIFAGGGNLSSYGGSSVINSPGSNGSVIFKTFGSEQMRLTSTGLGIGTSSPSNKLSIGGRLDFKTYSTNEDNFGLWAHSSDGTVLSSYTGYPIAFRIANSEKMRLDSSGKLGIGVTNPSVGLVVAFGTDGIIGNYYSSSGANSRISFSNTSLLNNNVSIGSSSDALVMYTGGSERARIDSSGNLLVGVTSQFAGANCPIQAKNGSVAQAVSFFWNATTTGDAQFVGFGTEASVTQRGSISYNRAGGLTVYNTTSDYRAKDIYGPVVDSGTLIDSVPVYMGKMHGATQERPMFIAHETPAYAHTGEKDAVDKDGNPVYQQMDASALIPVMWAEIQSLRKRLADAGIA